MCDTDNTLKENRTTVVLPVFECDKPTANGYVYPRDVMEKAVAEANDRIKKGQPMYGYIGRNFDEDNVSLSQNIGDAAIVVKGFGIDSLNHVVVEVKPLPNYQGKLAQELIVANSKPTLTSIGYTTDDNTITKLDILSVDFEPTLSNPK